MNVKMPAQAEIIRTLIISACVIDILLFLDSKTIMYINEPVPKPVYSRFFSFNKVFPFFFYDFKISLFNFDCI